MQNKCKECRAEIVSGQVCQLYCKKCIEIDKRLKYLRQEVGASNMDIIDQLIRLIRNK